MKTETVSETKATFSNREEAIKFAAKQMDFKCNSKVCFKDRHYDAFWAFASNDEDRFEVTITAETR